MAKSTTKTAPVKSEATKTVAATAPAELLLSDAQIEAAAMLAVDALAIDIEQIDGYDSKESALIERTEWEEQAGKAKSKLFRMIHLADGVRETILNFFAENTEPVEERLKDWQCERFELRLGSMQSLPNDIKELLAIAYDKDSDVEPETQGLKILAEYFVRLIDKIAESRTNGNTKIEKVASYRNYVQHALNKHRIPFRMEKLETAKAEVKFNRMLGLG